MTTLSIEDRIAQYLNTNGAGSARSAQSHARNILRIIETYNGPTQKTFSVSVDTEDIDEGQWNDLLIVLAVNEDEAKALATQHIANQRFVTEVLAVEAYTLSDGARVVGRVLNTDEE